MGGYFENDSGGSLTVQAINFGNCPAVAAYTPGGEIGRAAIVGESDSANGILGESHGLTGTALSGGTAGTWGDIGDGADGKAAGIIGAADNSVAGYFENDSKKSGAVTVLAVNDAPGKGTGLFKALMAISPDGTCGIGSGGSLTCTGQVKALATTGGDARRVETYAMESPENWMEDVGSGSLEHGVAVVTIDPDFAETVSETADYHVFLTPRGDSKGLYVTHATATSLEVRESGGGTSSPAFDYRIVARRRGYEAERLTDVTETYNTAMKAVELATTPRATALSLPRLRQQARSGESMPVRPSGPTTRLRATRPPVSPSRHSTANTPKPSEK